MLHICYIYIYMYIFVYIRNDILSNDIPVENQTFESFGKNKIYTKIDDRETAPVAPAMGILNLA